MSCVLRVPGTGCGESSGAGLIDSNTTSIFVPGLRFSLGSVTCIFIQLFSHSIQISPLFFLFKKNSNLALF